MLSSSTNANVRRGRPSDAEGLANVFREAWSHTYRGILPETHIEFMIERRSAAWWRRAIRAPRGFTTLEVSEDVVGYAIYGTRRSDGWRRGEIFELYIAPDYQGLGFGELLFESCRHRLDLRKYRGLVAWALAENERAIDFYWRRGGRPFTETTETFDKKSIRKIGFSWP